MSAREKPATKAATLSAPNEYEQEQGDDLRIRPQRSRCDVCYIPRMAFGIRTVAALAVALVAVAFAAESSPARIEFAADAFAQGKKFVSKRYGYEIVLPAGRYHATYAPIAAYYAWNGKDFPFGDSGVVDAFADGSDRKFIAAATRLSTGTTLRKWEASFIAVMQSFCKKARALRNTTLGGVPAREFTIVCPGFAPSAPGYEVIAVVALHRGRGYFFQFVSPTVNTAASDRRIFDAGRRTFRFTSN
jgi:hypothetical protein